MQHALHPDKRSRTTDLAETEGSLGSRILADKPAFCLAVVRLFLGALLVVKGAHYFRDQAALTQVMVESNVPLASAALARAVAVVHLAGGLSLAFGLFTRVGAAIQIPNVLGALVFVHARELFASDAFELPLLVLLLLVVFAWLGGDRWSTDWPFRNQPTRAPTKLRKA